jgi:hypothetical protein
MGTDFVDGSVEEVFYTFAGKKFHTYSRKYGGE